MPGLDWLVSYCRHKTYLQELAGAYLGDRINGKDPRVSPLYADVRGFPPTLIQVGSAETLLDDATRFAAVLGAADVAVTLEIWPHMIHAWHLWNAHLEPGRRALANAGAASTSIPSAAPIAAHPRKSFFEPSIATSFMLSSLAFCRLPPPTLSLRLQRRSIIRP